MQTIYIDPKDPSVSPVISRCYPSYNGKKASISGRTSYTLQDYWSGGSRTYAVAYDLASGQVVPTPQNTHNPMNKSAHTEFDIPAGVAIVEHVIFCGKDLGIRINVHPDSLAPLLPPKANLTDRQLKILATVRSYISSYRREVFRRNNVTEQEKDELKQLGYLAKNGSLTLNGRNAASGQPY